MSNGAGAVIMPKAGKESRIIETESSPVHKGMREKVREFGPKVAEKVETKVKTFEEQLGELRQTAHDKVTSSAMKYIVTGIFTSSLTALLAVADGAYGLGVPVVVYPAAFATAIATLAYGLGKGNGADKMNEEVKNLEKLRSARIKEGDKAAR